MEKRKRTLNEWIPIITECRQSGLSDAAWCEKNGISVSCFYNAVCRLRKKACIIPESAGKANTLDFTSSKQDVVKIEISSEAEPINSSSSVGASQMYLDNSYTIEIATNGSVIRLNNSVDPLLLERILHSLRAPLC